MGEATSSWRVFPEKVPAQVLLWKGEQAEACLDFVAAGHWYFHAKRKGSAEGWERAERLRTRFDVLAGQGNLDAKVLLAGLLLARGEQLPLAVSMLETAAAASVPEGMRELGFLLAKGLGVPADPQRANDLYLAAAELGDGYAAFNLAVNFYQGNGTGRNYRKFVKWLEVAGSLGIPEACAMLSSQCAKKGFERDSLRWYVKAAEAAHVPAMFIAARCYQEGTGTEVDTVQALRGLLAPLERGNGDGIHDARALAGSMTPEQVREAGRLSGFPQAAESFL